MSAFMILMGFVILSPDSMVSTHGAFIKLIQVIVGIAAVIILFFQRGGDVFW